MQSVCIYDTGRRGAALGFCLLGLALPVAWSASAHADQTPPARSPSPTAAATPTPTAPAKTSPRLYLSCATDCFEDYLRQELNSFDFVRDRHQANLLVQIVRQASGNGGERITVFVTPVSTVGSRPGDVEPSLSFATRLGTPPEEVRFGILQRILRLLWETLKDTPHAELFEFDVATRPGAALAALPDPWDYWVFSPELNAEGDATAQSYFMQLRGGITIRRITHQHKLRLRAQYERVLTRYVLEDGEDVRGDIYAWNSQGIYAYSLGNHWGVGGIGTARISQFENLRGHLRGGPLVEYNIFPYDENVRKQLRFAYQAGVYANWYFEPNVADKMQETRPYHALSAILDFNQAWGSFQWIVQGNAFLDHPSLFRLTGGAIFSLQIVEGLSVQFEGEASYVQDQISLRARPLTDRELLLWTSQMPTDFLAEATLGISYTWGSIHNTIVNPRFGRVDVEPE